MFIVIHACLLPMHSALSGIITALLGVCHMETILFIFFAECNSTTRFHKLRRGGGCNIILQRNKKRKSALCYLEDEVSVCSS